jgi:hypothetical protein
MCMKNIVVLTLLLATGQAPAVSAAPATATGPAAFALASVVAPYSPLLSGSDKRMIAQLFSGASNFVPPANRKLSVTVDSIVCRASDVDITARLCKLSFNSGKRTLKGRDANEIAATLRAAGIVPEGAAGSIIESLSKLVCTLDSNEIRQKAGGGAKCSFEIGQ